MRKTTLNIQGVIAERQRRLDALNADIRKLEADKAKINEEIALLRELERDERYTRIFAIGATGRGSDRRTAVPPPRPAGKPNRTKAVETVLEQAGEWLTAAELAKRLPHVGYQHNWGNAGANLRSIIRDHSEARIVLRQGRYGLREWGAEGAIHTSRADDGVVPQETASLDARGGEEPYAGLTLREAARRVLREASSALHLRELTRRVQAGGAHIGGEDAKRTLLGTIYRDPRFVNEGDNTWGLTEWQAAGQEDDEG